MLAASRSGCFGGDWRVGEWSYAKLPLPIAGLMRMRELNLCSSGGTQPAATEWDAIGESRNAFFHISLNT
jgi:hypothetical protein